MIWSNRTMRIIVLLLCAADCGDSLAEDTALIDVADLRIRDPFVVTDIPNARYIMVASIGNRQRGVKGWECYTSKDLRHWRAPVTVFTPPAGFWADRDFWAGNPRLPRQVLLVRDPQCGTCQTRHAAVRRRRSAGTVPRSHRRRCHAA